MVPGRKGPLGGGLWLIVAMIMSCFTRLAQGQDGPVAIPPLPAEMGSPVKPIPDAAIPPTGEKETFLYRLINRLIPESDRDPSPPPSVNSPGADTANFPNSSFTLPKGRAYLETSPFNMALAGDGEPQANSWPFLLRFGLTDRVELRLYSNGLTFTNGEQGNLPTSGFSPLIFDLKVHLWGEEDWMYWPSVGLEVYLQSELGSAVYNTGVEPGISLLFDHKLPNGWLLEWNVGDFGQGFPGLNNTVFMNLGVSWALQKQFNDKWAAFFQGFYNSADLPRFPSDLVVGMGFQWNPLERVGFFGSYNWSVDGIGSPANSYFGLVLAF